MSKLPVKFEREDLNLSHDFHPPEKVRNYMESTVNKIDRNVVKKFAFASLAGMTQPHMGPAYLKSNQDAYILHPNINKCPAMHLFAVADGHGTFGQEISAYVKQKLPGSLGA